jgi:hypothetical protein
MLIGLCNHVLIEMYVNYLVSNSRNLTENEYPERDLPGHYLPAMPSETLVEFSRRVAGVLNRYA